MNNEERKRGRLEVSPRVTRAYGGSEEDAMLLACAEDGKPDAEYPQDPGFFYDLPMDEIRNAPLCGEYMRH